jgi:hypothetical protein
VPKIERAEEEMQQETDHAEPPSAATDRPRLQSISSWSHACIAMPSPAAMQSAVIHAATERRERRRSIGCE